MAGKAPRLYAQIVGWGKYTPAKVLTNEHLASLVDTSDDWIRSRTGISRRHIADPRESTSTLAARAAQQAIAVADVNPRQIDLIIVATVSPDYPFPSVACQVQDALGIPHAAAFDLGAGCTGFVYALGIAGQLVATGAHRTALVIGAETLSRCVDWTDRNTCVLFGDGAGAVIVQATEEPTGLLGYSLGSDGSGADLLYIPAGGSRRPTTPDTVNSGLHYIRMNGSEVYRFAVDAMAKATREVMDRAGLGPDDLSLLIPHQANARIINAAARALKLPPERVFTNLADYGNTSAASIPIALCEAIEQGRVQTGDNLVLVGFGAGLTWGAVALKWGIPTRPAPLPVWKRALYEAHRSVAPVRSASHRLALRVRTLLSLADPNYPNGHRPWRRGGG